MTKTIFERYGGFSSVSRVVSSFYDRMMDSPVTSPFFAGVDMKRLIDHQTKFIASLMGGPASYTDDHLERVHANLGITGAAFQEALELLDDTMEEFGFSDEDRRTVCQKMLTHRSFIVTRP